MFFWDEKSMYAVPIISLWSNGKVLKENESKLMTGEENFLVNEERKISKYEKNEIDKWKKCFSAAGEEMTGGFLRSYISIETGNNSIDGISNKFSKIRNNDELIEFAFTYGNLGLAMEQKNIDIFEQLNQLDPNNCFTLTHWNAFENVEPGSSYFEPIELWWYHIDKVRKILKLYRVLSRLNRGEVAEIEDTILRIGEQTYPKRQPTYKVEWSDGTPTLVTVSEEDSSNFLKIGRMVLRRSIERYASKGIVIKASEPIETEKNKLGFYVLEKRTTEYLITAIYYDLWQKINTNLEVEICQNPKCQLPFVKIKRRQYCSDACKQEAYRIRKDDS